jgi:hypothetical protein
MKVHVLSRVIRDDRLGALKRGQIVDIPDHKAEFLRKKGEVEYYQTKVLRDRPRDGRWDTVVCIASGPSLTVNDVELVRQWRMTEPANGERRGVIVVNTTFKLAPWADGMFAMDRTFWNHYVSEIDATFLGERFSNNALAAKNRTTRVTMPSYGNSGAAAVSLASHFGAKKIILLGYDVKYGPDGKKHWHGDHPQGLGNAGRIHLWHVKFERLAGEIAGKSVVINASRDTDLKCFERGSLDELLRDGK